MTDSKSDSLNTATESRLQEARYQYFLYCIQAHGVLVEVEKEKEYRVVFKGTSWGGPENEVPIYRKLTRKERRHGVDLSQYIKP